MGWRAYLLILLLNAIPIGLLFYASGVWAGDDLESLRASLVIEQLKETAALMKWIIGGGFSGAAAAIAFLVRDILSTREKSREDVKVLSALVAEVKQVLTDVKEKLNDR